MSLFNDHDSRNVFGAPIFTQNNNTGSGNQFPGAIFSGTVIFGQNEPLRSRAINVLKKLNVSQYQDQKDRNPVRIPKTCEWFVTHQKFRAWQADQTSPILWVSANPGCGKSVLVKYLADFILTNCTSRAVGYFFFKDDFQDQRSITNALCCILHQLFYYHRDLLTETIIERFEMNERTTDSFTELWNILICATNEGNGREIICLLDALDECEEQGWAQLSKALHRLLRDEIHHNGNLKFLITSRPYGRIRRGFEPLEIPEQPVIHLSGESDDEMEKISHEINIFIEARVKAVGTRLKLREDEQVLLLEKLIRVPNRTYLWVYLTLDLIESNINIDKRGIVEATSNLPQTVDEAYERILSRSKDRDKARKLLHIVIGAIRPLTVQEMRFALALEKNHRAYADVDLGSEDRSCEYMRDLCGLFITIVDSKIYLLHQTAREFLVQERTPGNFLHLIHQSVKEAFVRDTQTRTSGNLQMFEWRQSLIPDRSHSILTEICTQHLLFTDFKEAQPSAENIPEFLDSHVFLDYSAKNWTVHWMGSDTKKDDSKQSLLTLCGAGTARCTTWFQIYWTSKATVFPSDFTSLMIGSYFGLKPVVKHWIGMDGIDLNAKDDAHGRSALSWAAGNGHPAIVKLLTTKRALRKGLRKEVKVDSADKHKRTPLSWAVLNGHGAVVSLLLNAGAAVDSVDDIGGTPLFYAICTERADVTKLLTKQGTGVQSKSDIQKELLLSAAKKGHEPVLTILLKRDADVETKDNEYGRTLLSWASGNGHIAAVKVLLERHADIKSMDSEHGRTPLSWAAKNGHQVVMGLLLQKANLESKVHIKSFRDIVGVIVLLHTPLSVDALARFLMISPDEIIDQFDSLDSLRTSFNIVAMPTDPNDLVHFLHLHFRDFLLNTTTDLNVEEWEMHKKIAAQCLRVMDGSLRRNICGLKSYATECKNISDQTINQCLPEELRYSCCHWAYHLEQSNEPLRDEVFGFLEKHFLHWLETMSILGMFSESIGILNKVMKMTMETDSKLSEFLQDAQQFISRNIQMSSFPLQLYYSAIAFAPGESVIRNTFRDTPLRIMTSLPATKQSWSGHSQILKGHSDTVRTVVFSPDGQMVASGSDDMTVRLWDVSGKALHTLGHSDTVRTVVFSPDSQMLASGSNRTVQLWDVTGKALHTLNGHLDMVFSVAFSPDGQMLASGSDDGTVRLWDVTGKILHILGHLGAVFSVAFSPDGQMVALGSDDMTVQLWDVTGKALHTLKGYSKVVSTVAFSPNGRILALGSSDATIRFWDVKTREALQSLEGHSRYVLDVVFSQDGQMLASCARNGTIQLWDMQTGKELHTLEGHLGAVFSVAFSPGGQMVASGSSDTTVRLWDAKTRNEPRTLKGHSDRVRTVVFSPDGQVVASGSDDMTVRLWDTKSGALRNVLHATRAVSSISFSMQGPYLDTDCGSFEIESFDDDHHRILDIPNPQVSLLEDWVVLGGVKALRLPYEYRNPHCFAIRGGALALGYIDGRVSIIEFLTEHLCIN